MESLFYHLLNFSINAGWIVFAVLILRMLLKKAPRWLVCLLWAIVGVRLIFPFSIESVFSLIPSAETVPPEIVYQQEPTIHSGIAAVNSVVNPVIGEYFAPEPASSVNPLRVLGFVASWAWLLGFVLMIGYMLFGYLWLRYRLQTATKRCGNIYESENVASPFILGIFRPHIYLPYGLDEATFSYVIAHEKAHLARCDHLIKPLAFLLLAVYWFQPLFWVAYILLCRDIEYACDEKVIKDESEEARRAYSMALLSCSIHRRSIAACPLAFGEVGVRERVKNVMNYKKPAFWIILLAVIAIVVTAVCFLTNPKADVPYEPPMYYAANKIIERDGTNYFEVEHIPYFYISENMTLYEKRKCEMTGCFVEEWKFCGVLEKAEGSDEKTAVWSLSCTDEFGNMSTKTFTFYKNGKVSYTYEDGKGGICVCQMTATDQMPGQLNVLSVTPMRADIGVSHFGTEISCEETKKDPYGDIRLDIEIKNNTEYILVHDGCEVYVDEAGVNRIRSSKDVRLEKKTASGWQTIDDYLSPFGWRSYGGNTARFFFDDEELEKGLYCLTFFVDLATKDSNFESEETVEYVEKNVPCAEIIFEIVNPGETTDIDAEMS